MNKSKYIIIKKLKSGNYLLFNTYNQSLSILSNDDYLFYKKNSFDEETKKYYYEQGILTDIDELEELKRINKETINDEEYAHYTIFTTSYCNANCYYCFEKNCNKLHMSESTANNIIKFIKDNSKNNKRIHIQWFGGEPLLNISIIDLISKEIISFCEKKRIKYTSNIVTNGSLLNDKVIDLIKQYNIVNIQITLDGTKEIYEKRKAYNKVNNSYDLVLNNIENSLKNDLDVSVRINFDKENIDDIMLLLDNLSYLNKYNKFRIYVMPIYGTNYNDKNLINSKNINEYFELLFNKMVDLKYIKSPRYFNLNRTSIFCKAYKNNTYVFFPDGDTSKCTHTKEINKIVDSNCYDCVYYPLCSGGCMVNESGCSSKCYIYKDSINSVLNAILRLSNIDDEIE